MPRFDSYRPHVVLMVETSTIYGRRTLQGITRYLRTHRPWSIYLEQQELGAEPPLWLKNWRGDGLITRTMTPGLVELIHSLDIKAVDLNDRCDPVGLPRINSDDEFIGRIAGEHLLQRGFRSFGFCGYRGEQWSRGRRDGFVAAISTAGLSVVDFETPWGGPTALAWEEEQATLGKWLSSMPKPVGVLCCNDMRGRQLIDAANRIDLAVPEQAAIVGVDDDGLLCELCDPQLTSVIPNAEQIGYEAAATLDAMMTGHEVPRAVTRIEPLGIAARQSTDTMAMEDKLVADSLHLIRQQACQGLTVPSLLKLLPGSISRTTLERRFRSALGHSPQAEIRNAQILRVKQLLTETDLSLDRISELAGFRHSEYLSFAFKRDVGETPGQYRRRVRMGMVAGSLEKVADLREAT